MSENLGYLFYKQYYWRNNSIDIHSLQRIMNGSKDCKINPAINSKLVNSKLPDFDHILSSSVHNKSFELSTIYPGLLIGSGYIHEAGFENEFKIGFHFDYTTGIPVIPGSSIKGMLRSVFPGKAKSNNDERKKYIKGLITEILKNTPANIDVALLEKIDIESLENQIFEGIKQDGKRIPVYQRDIFFEAFPFNSKNVEETFLAEDYITPHEYPLKNPVPLKFIKILPDVEFKFQFRLNDFNKQITAEIKKKLFEQIILDLGVGAKTNVGYGQFVKTIIQ